MDLVSKTCVVGSLVNIVLNFIPHVCVLSQPKAQKGKPAEKVVHPYSRKAAYLAREEIRLKRKERSEN